MSLSLEKTGRRPPTLARLPPLTALRAFVATARYLSFARAAKELHVTSAAIGQQVRLLEDHLGQSLFHRSRGGLELTEAGQMLMPGLSAAFDDVVDTIAKVLSGPGYGPFRVSVAPSFASKWLIPRLDALRRAAPDLEVLVDASSELRDLENGEADCAIRYGGGSWPGLESEPLFAEAVIPVCSPEFADRYKLYGRPAAVCGAPLLHEDGPEHDSSCPDWSKWLHTNGISEQLHSGSGLRLSQSALVIDAAIAGYGIGLAKMRLASSDLRAGRIVSPFGNPQPVKFSYFFATASRTSKADSVHIFRAWLFSEIAMEPELGGFYPLRHKSEEDPGIGAYLLDVAGKA